MTYESATFSTISHNSHTTDFYPTRLDRPAAPIPRRCPIIHTDRPAGPLDQGHLERFERDGFLWFEGFFDTAEVAPFFDELAALEDDPALHDDERLIRDPRSGAVRSVFAMHELSQRFARLFGQPRLLDMIRQLLGGDVYIHQSRINDKAGFQGSGFEWHSDFETWHAEDGMPGMRAISASLMLTDNLEFNGPLMLVPGSHRQFIPTVGRTPPNHWQESLKAQAFGVPDYQTLDGVIKQHGIQAPKGPAGSLLLFDCNTLHASNANLSPWPRANLFCVYNSVDNALVAPFAADQPRPEYLASRRPSTTAA
ncbi:ectoine hydroxylase [Franzmannia qiaohouensis]|uniref:Ectoine hydroxylase n=1 Tax=Franzmannia qiaohouensis TaxID=1329370 RepID=A0ABU1HAV7_9GAMM|nr:ectoine hydroxylase [Halomonas qiaohouensis]MDR5904596.1 ectoine hydroxylase [Halomonas qiaohouensis]